MKARPPTVPKAAGETFAERPSVRAVRHEDWRSGPSTRCRSLAATKIVTEDLMLAGMVCSCCGEDRVQSMVERTWSRSGSVEGCAHDERSVWFADPDRDGLHGW